jgi:hypothetical protein
VGGEVLGGQRAGEPGRAEEHDVKRSVCHHPMLGRAVPGRAAAETDPLCEIAVDLQTRAAPFEAPICRDEEAITAPPSRKEPRFCQVDRYLGTKNYPRQCTLSGILLTVPPGRYPVDEFSAH